MSKKHIELILFFTWSLWISLEFLLGPFSHVRIHDNGDGLLPQLIASKYQFSRYGLSYFADYVASGIDVSSQFLLPFSNLNSLLFIILPPWLAYGILMFFQRFLASYFTYRLCRDSLKLPIFTSVIGGLLFSLFNFSTFSFTLYHQLGLPALPLILWTLDRITNSKSITKYLFSFLFGLLTGYSNYFVYFTPYLLPFIFIWFFYLKGIIRKDILASLMIFTFSATTIQLPSIIAVFLNIQSSHRIFWGFLEYQEYLPAVYRLVNSIFWSNLVAISFIIFAIILNKKLRGKLAKRLLILSISFILITIIAKIAQPILPSSLGVARTFSTDRFDMIIAFLLVITSINALNLALKTKSPLFNLIVYFLIFIALFAGSVKIKIETITNYAPYRSLYQHPDLVRLSKQVNTSLERVATVTGGGIRSSYPLAYSLSTVDSYLTLYPANYHQFWSKVIAKRIAEDKLRYEDFIIWGNRIYLYGPANFYELENIEFKKYYDLDLLSLANVKYIISQKPITNEHLILLPSDYREKFKSWDSFSKNQKLKKFFKGDYFGPPLYIYENKKVLPRFFILEDNKVSVQVVNVDNYSPDKIELSLNPAESVTLIATINYYPWWKVTINGKIVPIDKYQSAFMSIQVPKGANQVILQYLPPYRI